jgi:membrane associated rhomboid family serine protease
MIPLSALIRRMNPATMTVLIIVANVLVSLWDFSLSPRRQQLFVMHYAMVPDRLHLASLLTSMFLHAGWVHLIGNMWFLWVFGSHIEDVMGAPRFLAFYLSCGVTSAIVQLAMTLHSPVPTLGASGAIAGVMGAFLVLYPRVRVRTLIFIVIFITTVEIPAAFMLIYWFVIQLVNGLFSSGSFSDSGGTAWFAHVGGFLTGLFLIRLFPNTSRRYIY